MAVGRVTVQVDWPDTETERGLHLDSYWPSTYEAFLYLTPVTGPENDPSPSCRDRIAIGSTGSRRSPATSYTIDRGPTSTSSTPIEDARCLLGEPGTAIFADQRLAHASWPGQTTGTSFMLVAYFYDRSA
jgi:hypothetical protein